MTAIKTLALDLETFSDVDLKKSGVYPYAESSSFEILLLGYSINGGEVHVVDIACGETVPDEVLAALTDDSVEKWAYNAQFERICLSNWLRRHYPQHFRSYSIPEDTVGNYLNPSSWKCSRIWGAYMGLPLSLKGIGAILKLGEQKMEEGADLIKYFCKPCRPTKKNGGRTRNLPHHDLAKWALFKKYNKRDVEVELAIKEKLAKFPVPEFIWDEYHHDQEINDRGILVDMRLVEQAIEIDAKTKQGLRSWMQRQTGLENPNSVAQMKGWLADNGIKTESLDKKAVREIIPNAGEHIADVLSCRQQLAKSSVSKYTAMQNAVCADGRARGMFQFYGASRSGRWCLTGNHEVLTPEGWVRLDEWSGGRIACWNASSEAVSFQAAEQVNFDYNGLLYTYHDARIDQASTPDHKMWVQKRYGGEWMDMTVESMAKYRPSIPLTGYRYHRGCANPAWLRVLIMTQADATYTDDGSVKYHFKKHRKTERCKHLLRKAEIPFVSKTYGDATTITVPAKAVPLWLREFRTKTFGFWLFDENPDIFFDELPNWDGYMPAPNSIQYSTCNKQNADIVQALAHMSGRTASIRIKRHNAKNPNWNDVYVVDIWLTPKNCHEIRVKPSITEYSGKVYCAVTKTGYFLVRRNGKVWVTGNSGKIIQMQNLPQNHMDDLAEARALVRDGNFDALEMLYDNIPNVLSELIRTAFIPKPGYKYIVADFSAIEARVLSFLAGEQWRIDVFKDGKDIYCESASQMFHIPVVKNGINGHLRQKGKIAELALGYGGSVGALKAMGALEMGLNEEELQPLVDSWRQANPNITRFWWDIDSAVKKAVLYKSAAETHGFKIYYKSGMLFIDLPSGRRLCYVKPRMGVNQFGSDSVTYEGTTTGKWGRIESYGPKFVENIVQAVSRDILAYAMKTLRHCFIVGHVHDELIVECSPGVSLDAVCEQMGRTPPWIKGLLLRADGYECGFYQKQ